MHLNKCYNASRPSEEIDQLPNFFIYNNKQMTCPKTGNQICHCNANEAQQNVQSLENALGSVTRICFNQRCLVADKSRACHMYE